MTGWVIETLIATSMLMAIVLLLRAPVRRAFGPRIAYALWALPVLRMLLPPMPREVRGAAEPMLAIVPEDIIVSLGQPVATLSLDPVQGLGWPAWAAALWLAGATAFMAYHLIAHSRFCARLLARARSTAPVAQGRVAMIESDAAAGPLAFGIWRKYVAFPADFAERYDDLERDLALAHELGHHARGDLLANWVALAMLALHWFNPLAWAAFRAFRADQEMACDALVLADRPATLRHAYGRAIVKSAHGGAVSAACHLHTINEIKGRLRMLTKHHTPSRGRRIAGVAGIGSLMLAGLAVTASGTEAADELRADVETRIGMPLDEISLPPIAPLPPMVQDAPKTPVPPIPAAPAAQGEPTTPEMPEIADLPDAGPVPPMPPVPPVPGKEGDVSVYRYTRDGKVTVLSGAGADKARVIALRDAAKARGRALILRRDSGAMPPMPEILKAKCGGDGEPVRDETNGTTRVTVICTDRIEGMAANAIKDGKWAMRSARMSLDMARRTIEREPNLTAEQRRDALQGIEQAMAEVREAQ